MRTARWYLGHLDYSIPIIVLSSRLEPTEPAASNAPTFESVLGEAGPNFDNTEDLLRYLMGEDVGPPCGVGALGEPSHEEVSSLRTCRFYCHEAVTIKQILPPCFGTLSPAASKGFRSRAIFRVRRCSGLASQEGKGRVGKGKEGKGWNGRDGKA
jgi:hypothetical protein